MLGSGLYYWGIVYQREHLTSTMMKMDEEYVKHFVTTDDSKAIIKDIIAWASANGYVEFICMYA